MTGVGIPHTSFRLNESVRQVDGRPPCSIDLSSSIFPLNVIVSCFRRRHLRLCTYQYVTTAVIVDPSLSPSYD